eukprot:TRINITY_DN11480_c0_g1_i1.p1 TRINITY_DN11480_c0_g1~~TRINITY_DN11480_c0_g1_i1.p1  ORF type:complete len:595 (+),score=88.99 TRINITY_DN11480_c0_g1_i1:64-1848(+)
MNINNSTDEREESRSTNSSFSVEDRNRTIENEVDGDKMNVENKNLEGEDVTQSLENSNSNTREDISAETHSSDASSSPPSLENSNMNLGESADRNGDLEKGKEDIIEVKDRIWGLREVIFNPRYTFEKSRHRTIGQVWFSGNLSKWTLWPISFAIAFSYLVLIFGVIPLGRPLPANEERTKLSHTWVLITIVNPLNGVVIGFLHVVVFLCCMGVERPFRVKPIILMATFVVPIVIFAPSIPFTGFFDLFGAAAIGLALITTYAGIYIYEWNHIKRSQKDWSKEIKKARIKLLTKNFIIYVKMAFAVVVFAGILVIYIFAFEFSRGTVGQKFIPFVMAAIVFIARKALLSITDPFPHEIAMFVSGFWIENLYDMFQSMAYPSISEPTTYITVFIPNFLSLIANIAFLTSPWYNFRCWVKATVYSVTKDRKLNLRPTWTTDFRDIEDERGHSFNLPGYQRRQVRFYFLKVISKMIAGVFYVLVATILRYGPNSKIYPFGILTSKQYRYSIIFSSINFIAFFIAGLIGWVFIILKHKEMYEKMKRILRYVLEDRTYIGLFIAVLIHNGIFAVYMLMYFNRIWFAFDVHNLPPDFFSE